MKNFKKVIYTFIASVIMVYLESKIGFINFILSFFGQCLSLSKTTQKDLFICTMSFMTSFITFLIEDLIEKNKLNIHIKYYDSKKQKLKMIKREITYSEELPTDYIDMKVSLKYSKLCKLLFANTKILISLNPRIGKLDLDKKFIDNKYSHFEAIQMGILYDFTKDFVSSDRYTSIDIYLVIQCHKPGNAEIQVDLRGKGCFSKILLVFFRIINYFKIDSPVLSIKSEKVEN
ncbi:hypothetical protein GYU96_02095 [Lactobacillus mellis]|uniref:hypothetical protein n=1 Tax=Bombilactobacillus mellis TaxID=1218508 RepID=UPI001580DF40|nr:hypothetical protein [Bombilactobacillus mellis]NUG66647.1 hypothetical protein [Bombilactobacillus mellis]